MTGYHQFAALNRNCASHQGVRQSQQSVMRITERISRSEMQKTYERANNVHVKCFLSRVKFEPNFTLFCRKSELCRDFAHLGVIFQHFLEIDVTFWYFFVHYLGLLGLLRCYANSLLSQFTHFFRVKLFMLKPCSCKKVVFLYLCSRFSPSCSFLGPAGGLRPDFRGRQAG